MKILLIVPAYNEANNILSVVNSIVEAGYDYIVINDGSSDRTLDVCKENNINVLNLEQNLGIGGAVQAGHKYAQKYGYDVDIQFDGDGQHDISYAKDLLLEIENGADLVVGSRFLKETEGFQSTFMRRLGIKWLEFLIKALTNVEITDATSGFRASGKRAIDLFCQRYPMDYPEPESIVYAHKAGLTVSEVSVVMHSRQSGKSSIAGLSSAYYMIKVSLAILILSFSRRQNA